MPRIFGSASTGGGGTPGGSTTQVQYNNAGAFGGVTGATTNGTFLTLTTPVLGVAAGTSLALAGNGALSAPVLSGTGTWITGGTATTTKPYALIEPTGTTSTGWSTAGTGLGVNAATGFAGNLLDLQLAGVSQLKVTGVGSAVTLEADATSSAVFTLKVGGTIGLQYYGGSGWGVQPVNIGAAGGLALNGANTAVLKLGTSGDLIVSRPAAATLQHGAADAAAPVAQTIKFQDVVAGTSNTAGVNATIQAPAGTGTGNGGSLIFQVAPAGSSGSAKNAWATALTIASNKDATFTGNYLTASAGYVIANNGFFGQGANGAGLRGSGTDGILLLNSAENAFGSLKFGGITSSFPAIKRSTTTLQARLADDSAFTAIQGKLTTDTAYVATPQVPTGYITIYDSTGTAYKVSVNV